MITSIKVIPVSPPGEAPRLIIMLYGTHVSVTVNLSTAEARALTAMLQETTAPDGKAT